jgi:hypothetical protein
MGDARMVLAASFLAAGCAASLPPLSQLPAVCESPWRSGAAPPSPEEMTLLLLRGYDPATRTVTRPALDCTGAQVRWESPALACADSTLAQTPLSERPLGAEDVIISPVGEGHSLLWIPTTRYAAGDAAGPVGLVRDGEHRLEVVALGVLRAYPRRSGTTRAARTQLAGSTAAQSSPSATRTREPPMTSRRSRARRG